MIATTFKNAAAKILPMPPTGHTTTNQLHQIQSFQVCLHCASMRKHLSPHSLMRQRLRNCPSAAAM